MVTGLAFLPMVIVLMISANVGQIVLMPRTGPKPLIGFGMLAAAAGMAWLTGLGVHSGYATSILPPLLVAPARWAATTSRRAPSSQLRGSALSPGADRPGRREAYQSGGLAAAYRSALASLHQRGARATLESLVLGSDLA